MRRLLTAVLAVTLVFAACGGDDTPEGLTDEQAQWCSFASASDDAALRFDEIFEAGLGLGLPMDALNATAAQLRTDYEAEGMSPDEAIRAVSDDLLENETFIAACIAAYERFSDT